MEAVFQMIWCARLLAYVKSFNLYYVVNQMCDYREHTTVYETCILVYLYYKLSNC